MSRALPTETFFGKSFDFVLTVKSPARAVAHGAQLSLAIQLGNTTGRQVEPACDIARGKQRNVHENLIEKRGSRETQEVSYAGFLSAVPDKQGVNFRG